MESSKRLIAILFFRFCIALLYLVRFSSQEDSTSSKERLIEHLQTTSVAKITASQLTRKPNATTTTARKTTATKPITRTITASSHSTITSTTTTTTTTTTKTKTATKTTTTSPTTRSYGLPSSVSSTTNETETSNSTSSSTSSSTLTSVVSPGSSSPVSKPESTSITGSVESTNNNNNIIIGVVVGVGGAILIAALAIFVVCWCRRSKFKGVKTKSSSSTTASIGRHRVRESQPIKVSDFLDYVDRHQRDIKSYKAEFDSLPGGNNVGKSVSRATQPQNTRLNRYINILPFDDTLVPLNKSIPQQGYINASFVDGYKKEKAYIASQAPVADSLGDFWQMIWEHNSTIVIMVTNLFECGRAKCDKYWPNVDDSVTYGSIKVEGVAERSYGDYILRTFQVEKQISSKEKLKSSKSVRKSTDSLGEKQELVERRNVLQFHFTTWPDQGVPNTCSSLLKFYRHALKKPPPGREDGPIVIHCSAGVGRTGTLMAVDFCLEQAKDQGTVDVLRCIDAMRHQRMFMVQTVEQLIYIHHVLLEVLTLDKVEIPCSQFDPIYRQITEPRHLDGLSRIQREYKVLDVLKPRYDGSHFTLAQKNQEKNRRSTLLPVDTFLPYVKSEDGQNDIYINAVHVCGYTKKCYDDDDDDDDAGQSPEYNCIATQSPMRETIEDFWTMIKETGSSTIVMLNELEGVEKYWPEDGRTVENGPFVITNMGEISSEEIRVTDLQVTCRRNSQVVQVEPTSSACLNDSRRGTRHNKDTFNVRHFRLITWPDPMPRESVLMSLYSEVLRCRERNPARPVVVHCLYGVERCGLFCGVMNVLDAIRHDAEVDVFNAVKRIRRTRPEFIEDWKQYKYLYDVAMEGSRSMEKIDHENTMGK